MSEQPSIFLDANIFIDILQARSGWENSMALVASVKRNRVRGSLSSLTVAIIHYIHKRQVSDRRARQDIKNMTDGFDILAVTSEHIRSSLSDEKRQFSDFEDALQFHCAKDGKAEVIVTRNKRHFSKAAGIQVMTPEEFLKKYPPHAD